MEVKQSTTKFIANFFSWSTYFRIFLDVGIVSNFNALELLNYNINGMNRFVLSIMNQLHFNSFEPEWLAEHLNYVILLSIIAWWSLLTKWSMPTMQHQERCWCCWRLRNMLPVTKSIQLSQFNQDWRDHCLVSESSWHLCGFPGWKVILKIAALNHL